MCCSSLQKSALVTRFSPILISERTLLLIITLISAFTREINLHLPQHYSQWQRVYRKASSVQSESARTWQHTQNTRRDSETRVWWAFCLHLYPKSNEVQRKLTGQYFHTHWQLFISMLSTKLIPYASLSLQTVHRVPQLGGHTQIQIQPTCGPPVAHLPKKQQYEQRWKRSAASLLSVFQHHQHQSCTYTCLFLTTFCVAPYTIATTPVNRSSSTHLLILRITQKTSNKSIISGLTTFPRRH